ncbi:hypothetical protein DFJ63DRAFT_313568 [Scheffersomyces coipomensis]|uniref:uncharacterized protein n=1 Tax=Scheffersomyces coipomensis TaxID=1788519 RepID=UPI00315D4A6A
MSDLKRQKVNVQREFKFKIDPYLIEESVRLIKQHSQDVNYNYLQEVRRIPLFEELKIQREVEFDDVSSSVDAIYEQLRKEIATRLFYFHKFVGNQSTFGETRRYESLLITSGTTVMATIYEFISKKLYQMMDEVETTENLSFCQKIFTLSTIFCSPFPPINQEQDSSSPKSQQEYSKIFPTILNQGSISSKSVSSSFNKSRAFFNNYRQIDVDHLPKDYDALLNSTSITMEIMDMPFMMTVVDTSEIDSESDVVRIFYQAVLEPVKRLLGLEFGGGIKSAHEKLQERISKPDFYMEYKINGQNNFRIPVEFKHSGIMGMYKKNGSQLIGLLNQILYQMLTLSTHIGLICDKSTMIVVETSPEAKPYMSSDPVANIQTAKINCNVTCFNYDSPGFSPSLLLFGLFKDYFQKASIDDVELVKKIFDSMKLNVEDKEAAEKGKYKFIANEWKNGFNKYRLNGDYYIREDTSGMPEFKIPSEFFAGMFDGNINFKDTIKQSDFEIVDTIQGDSEGDIEGNQYHSKVYRIRSLNGRHTLTPMVLKVYDPVASPYIAGHTQVEVFWSCYLFSLGMYLNENRAYNKLRDQDGTGLSTERPTSSDSSDPKAGYFTPFIYSKGFLDWSINNKRVSGFFLLMEEIPNDYPSSEEEFQRLAEIGLKEIHARDVIHGDIKPSNFKFNAAKSKVIFYDFGFSHIENAADFNVASSKAKDLENLKKAVTKAFASRPLESIV